MDLVLFPTASLCAVVCSLVSVLLSFRLVGTGPGDEPSVLRDEVQDLPHRELRPRTVQEVRSRSLLGSGLQRSGPRNSRRRLIVIPHVCVWLAG